MLQHRSLNEVEGAVRQAGIGAGVPNGFETDIAAAARWLEMRGFDGIRMAVAALKAICKSNDTEYADPTIGPQTDGAEQRYQSPPNQPVMPSHGLSAGPILAEEMQVRLSISPDFPASWSGQLSGPLGVLPFLSAACVETHSAHLIWHSPDSNAHALALCAGGAIRVRYSDAAFLNTTENTYVEMALFSRPMAVNAVIPSAHILDAWDLDRRRDNALRSGVEVEEYGFFQLAELADPSVRIAS